jgi:hypothetical protein
MVSRTSTILMACVSSVPAGRSVNEFAAAPTRRRHVMPRSPAKAAGRSAEAAHAAETAHARRRWARLADTGRHQKQATEHLPQDWQRLP